MQLESIARETHGVKDHRVVEVGREARGLLQPHPKLPRHLFASARPAHVLLLALPCLPLRNHERHMKSP